MIMYNFLLFPQWKLCTVFLILPILHTVSSTNIKFPAMFEKCKRNNSTCLAAAIENAFHQLNHPISEFGIPSLNPLEIPEVVMADISYFSFKVSQHFHNLSFFGFDTAIVDSARFDFQKNNFVLNCHGKFRLDTNFDLKGKLFIIGFDQKGSTSLLIDHLVVNISANFHMINKHGKQFLKFTDTTVALNPHNGIISFGPTFLMEYEELNDMILRALNDNWHYLFASYKDIYEETCGRLLKSILNNIFMRIPLDDFFLD